MDKNGLEAIYRCIDKSKIKEISIKTGKGTKIKLTRNHEEIVKNFQKSQKEILKNKFATQENPSLESNRFDIVSPEVGFFNRFDPKSKQQFQKLRNVVQKGEVVATIVSLHVHHNVIAEQKGKIIEFLVEQDQPIAFGQPLIRLEKVYSVENQNG